MSIHTSLLAGVAVSVSLAMPASDAGAQTGFEPPRLIIAQAENQEPCDPQVTECPPEETEEGASKTKGPEAETEAREEAAPAAAEPAPTEGQQPGEEAAGAASGGEPPAAGEAAEPAPDQAGQAEETNGQQLDQADQPAAAESVEPPAEQAPAQADSAPARADQQPTGTQAEQTTDAPPDAPSEAQASPPPAAEESASEGARAGAAEEQKQPDAEATGRASASTQSESQAVVEQQLEAQGDKAEADSVRMLREQLFEQLGRALGVPPQPRPAAPDGRRPGAGNVQPQAGGYYYDRDVNQGRIVEERAGRVVVDLGGGDYYVEQTVPDEGGRLLYGASDVEVQQLPNGRTRTIVYRRNGVQIITVRDRYGEIERRFRRLPDGRDIVLIDNRFPEDDVYRRPIIRDLPPPRVDIPGHRYVVDLGQASHEDVRWALTAPPVSRIDRRFTLEEVLRNERVRAYSPRIDLDTITFDFGSATIGEDQMPALFALGEVMEEVIDDNPEEVYLIEGHTDAVGSDYDNLILSDRRAEAVAVALSQNFDIPPENLVTEGYGERYLKIATESPERRNRRATVRRLTELLQTQN